MVVYSAQKQAYPDTRSGADQPMLTAIWRSTNCTKLVGRTNQHFEVGGSNQQALQSQRRDRPARRQITNISAAIKPPPRACTQRSATPDDDVDPMRMLRQLKYFRTSPRTSWPRYLCSSQRKTIIRIFRMLAVQSRTYSPVRFAGQAQIGSASQPRGLPKGRWVRVLRALLRICRRGACHQSTVDPVWAAVAGGTRSQ